ncbi:hypothetical protein GMMP15_830048 [Candidatus Magnetomoraceae bacterium gMMP-15]
MKQDYINLFNKKNIYLVNTKCCLLIKSKKYIKMDKQIKKILIDLKTNILNKYELVFTDFLKPDKMHEV